MQFAEVFLRLGSGLVSWMMLYTYFFWLAALSAIGCGPDGDEMHRLLLGLAPFVVVFALLLRVTRPLGEIHRILRWLGIPLLLLMPWVLRSVWTIFAGVNLGASAICSEASPALWEQLWVPTQAVTLAVAGYMVVRVWISALGDARGKTRE